MMIMNILRLTLCLFSFTLLSVHPPSFGQDSAMVAENPASSFSEPVTVSLVNEHQTLQPGKPTWIAIRMSIEDNWHAYWKNPGDAGMAPSVNWSLPDGFQVGELQWPTPTSFSLSSAVGLGYHGEVTFLAEITPPSSFDPSTDAKIIAEMRWVVCSDATCLPGEAQIDLSLPVKKEKAALSTESSDLFAKARAAIPKKHEAIKAQRKNGLIEVTFDGAFEDASAFQDVKFFPEQKGTIDYKTEITLNPSAENPGQHTLILKDDTSTPDKTSSLKGVLVFNESGSKSHSFEVDIAIASDGNDSGIISMAASLPSEDKFDLNPSTLTTEQDDFSFKGGLPLALLFAFLGGMILNLMPCVLPVISLKVLSFVKLAGESRKLIFRHGAAFSAGVLISFWVLAGALLALQAYGRAVGWGFQLQEPIFVAILASGIFIFALSLFGLFEIGTSLISVAGNSKKQEGLLGSFLSGILATAVATPCTGPFLGSAVGFAVTLPAPLAMLIFTFLGLGMSFPYLLLAAFPSLLRFMPKAGNWMITFKELMGFLMLATVLWLVWIFGAQTNSLAITLLLAGFFLMALACWIYGRGFTLMNTKLVRRVSLLSAAVLFACGSYTVISSTSPWVEAMGGTSSDSAVAYANDGWEEFSVERIAELRKQGIPVFVDFTAKWCLICQANHLVLTTDEVNEQFNKQGVVKMKADWTKRDSTIAGELRKFGRNSVPLYVLYGTEEEAKPQILPQVLTPNAVVDSLKQL